MTPVEITMIMFASMLILMLLGLPITFCLGTVGVLATIRQALLGADRLGERPVTLAGPFVKSAGLPEHDGFPVPGACVTPKVTVQGTAAAVALAAIGKPLMVITPLAAVT